MSPLLYSQASNSQPSCCVFCPSKLREQNPPPNCNPQLYRRSLFSQLPARYLSDVTHTYVPQSVDTYIKISTGAP